MLGRGGWRRFERSDIDVKTLEDQVKDYRWCAYGRNSYHLSCYSIEHERPKLYGSNRFSMYLSRLLQQAAQHDLRVRCARLPSLNQLVTDRGNEFRLCAFTCMAVQSLTGFGSIRPRPAHKCTMKSTSNVRIYARLVIVTPAFKILPGPKSLGGFKDTDAQSINDRRGQCPQAERWLLAVAPNNLTCSSLRLRLASFSSTRGWIGRL